MLAALIAIAAVVVIFLLFLRNTFISFSRPSGGTVTFSRTGVSLEAASDHYGANGFGHIEPYVSRLLVPTNRFKFLRIFTRMRSYLVDFAEQGPKFLLYFIIGS